LIRALVLLAALSGCITLAPLAPHPTVVYVPHPDQADASLDMETLREMYTVSPDVNPDGFGSVEWIWEQSYMTLVVWALEEKRLELERLSHARSGQEHRQVRGGAELKVKYQVMFEGFLIGDFARPLDPAFYLPESVYLIDDRGQKFYPVFAGADEPVLPAFTASEFGAAFHSYARIRFPGGAILPETRSVTLYFSAYDRRIAFTWVFDPSYEPPGGVGGPRQRRLWSTR
jgi:hypothetical protein